MEDVFQEDSFSLLLPYLWEAQALGFDDAVIAGGAVRDSILGNSIKDVDVFTRKSIPIHMCMPHEALPDEYNIDRIKAVTRPITVQGLLWPMQIIQLNNDPDGGFSMNCVHDFCFGLCQAWMDEYGMYTTDLFVQDVLNQQFTVTYCKTEAEARHIIKKHQQLFDKYPWPLIIPETFRLLFLNT